MRPDYQRIARYLESLRPPVAITFQDLERALGAPLPASARRHRAWWANTQPRARAWTNAGLLVAGVDLASGTVRFAAGIVDQREQRAGHRSRWPQEKHLAALNRDFKHYLDVSSKRRIFTGPSVHFYDRTVECVRAAPRPVDLVGDRTFRECVYATLTAWGMHRMGVSVFRR